MATSLDSFLGSMALIFMRGLETKSQNKPLIQVIKRARVLHVMTSCCFNAVNKMPGEKSLSQARHGTQMKSIVYKPQNIQLALYFPQI